MSDVVAVVFARGGSKGLPGKNLRPLGGVPLVARSVAVGMASPSVDRVVISTDDPEIARIAVEAGATQPFVRPSALATDEAPEWLAWQHAVTELRSAGRLDLLVSLPPTAPLRSVADVEACVAACTDDVDAVITVTPAIRNPYFNMVTLTGDGIATLAATSDVVHRRQDAPPMFDITTVAYVARPDYVLSASSLLEGRVRAVEVPRDRALDIDDELDFLVAETVLSRTQR